MDPVRDQGGDRTARRGGDGEVDDHVTPCFAERAQIVSDLDALDALAGGAGVDRSDQLELGVAGDGPAHRVSHAPAGAVHADANHHALTSQMWWIGSCMK